MFREIKRMGFKIINGTKHFRVIDPMTGEQLAVLPHGQRAYSNGRNATAVLVQLRRHKRET